MYCEFKLNVTDEERTQKLDSFEIEGKLKDVEKKCREYIRQHHNIYCGKDVCSAFYIYSKEPTDNLDAPLSAGFLKGKGRWYRM